MWGPFGCCEDFSLLWEGARECLESFEQRNDVMRFKRITVAVIRRLDPRR